VVRIYEKEPCLLSDVIVSNAYVFSYCALAEDRERATSMNSALPIWCQT